MYEIYYTKQAQKDATNIVHNGLKQKVEVILEILRQDPYKTPPPYKKLVGNLAGFYSRRINLKHRVVYQVGASKQVVKILRMWTHYSG